ncbi:chloride channel [Auriculariales sp. MPI-PUGE-AT-0066]|nr:chloride channel [Auriculariales sp. MPI-PUGE-AT-0066]
MSHGSLRGRGHGHGLQHLAAPTTPTATNAQGRSLLSQEGSTDSGHWASYGTVGPSSASNARLRSTTYTGAGTGTTGTTGGMTMSMSFASLHDSVRRRHPHQSSVLSTGTLTRPRSLWTLASRPLTAYDAPLNEVDGDTEQQPKELDESGARLNGVRVWYSSFTSIDWLHDAIKDSARRLHLRRRRSPRGRFKAALDRSLGWIVVTLVGVLTALIAFFIVRSEAVLFDLKEGVWRRFCCPISANDSMGLNGHALNGHDECSKWRTWAQLLHVSDPNNDSGESEAAWIVDYMIYIIVALILAGSSCILTLKLTASTSFVSNKDSGVLSPHFVGGPSGVGGGGKTNRAAVPEPEPEVVPRKVMYFAAGSGIPEVKTILSGFVIHGYLGGRTLFTKAVGLTLSVASGLTLGKEGPFVHIASCIGNIVSRFFVKYETNEAKRREILSAACAAGVAVAFGAPVGGTLFSLEEVSYFFPAKVMWRSFFCAMIAAGTLKFLNPFGTGKLVLFQVTYDSDWKAYELVPFVFLGVVGGAYGAWFSKLNYRWSRDVRNASWLKTHPLAEVLLVTLFTTLLSFLNPFTRMGGTELVYNLFAECHPTDSHAGTCVDPRDARAVLLLARSIAVAMLVKGVLTIVTFGIKLPAGIFVPTLGVGACAGRIVGVLVQAVEYRVWGESQVIPGVYAMVGAAAALSGATRTTVSLAVIMFELTDTLTYVIPVMLGVLVAKTVADALEPRGIYDLVIQLNQLPYLESKHQYLWGGMSVADVAERHVAVIRLDEDNTVEHLRDKLRDLLALGDHDTGFPIVRRDRTGLRMVGYIGVNELEHALSIVADTPHVVCQFSSVRPGEMPGAANDDAYSVSSMTSAQRAVHAESVDPLDFSVYMDQAPMTVQVGSPLELVQQLFVKLGARYLVVTDTDGFYEGVIDKKAWLAFLHGLEDEH